MSEATQNAHATIEPEPPEVHDRNLWAGARLLVSSTIFLFLPFFFAYLYLAALNTGKLWKPASVEPPIGWGIAIYACVAAAAGLVAWARSELADDRSSSARPLLLFGLVAGVLAVVLQGVEYSQLDFGPMDGGFASVFVAWSGMFGLVVLGTMLWLETIIATSVRHGAGSRGAGLPELDGMVFYLTFLAGLGALTFGFLYLI
jgi:heme/copper-type cytochrome/quinol oxidase subunit 3